MVSMLKAVATGGFLWRVQPNSPGRSFAVEQGTRFKIALEGPSSNRFIEGTCQDGRLTIASSDGRLLSFSSANEAVNTVREPSSNAYLFVHFLVDGDWRLADDIRREPDRSSDIDETALSLAISLLREKLRAKRVKPPDEIVLTKAGARLALENPAIRQEAERRVSELRKMLG